MMPQIYCTHRDNDQFQQLTEKELSQIISGDIGLKTSKDEEFKQCSIFARKMFGKN